ncbi:MAG: S9 family peptidase [Chloroflexi bacterium]|nr:S9 family peptidase [Chloroflexota bacterium]
MTDQNPKHAVIPEDYFKLQYISEAHLSPDGKVVAYGVQRYNAEKDEDCTALWLLNLESGINRQLTSGEKTDSGFAWSPDGQKIAFASTRVEPPQIFILPLSGGEAIQLTHFKTGIKEGPYWSPDGGSIAFTAMEPCEPKDPAIPYRVTRNIFRFNELGYLDENLTDIYVISSAGGEPRRLTHDNCLNSNLAWSPDGQEILFLASHYPHTFEVKGVLKSVDMQGNIYPLVSDDWGSVNSAVWMPNGKICFSGMLEESKMGHKADLWVINRRGGIPQCRTEKLLAEVSGDLQDDTPVRPFSKTIVSRDSKTAFIRVQRGGNIEIWEVGLTGPEACQPLVQVNRSAILTGMTAEKFLYVGSSWNEPTNLYLCDHQGKNEQKLTHLNDDLMKDWLLPEVETIHFKGADDVEIEGWLMKPTTAKAPFPTILNIHGGPSGAYGNAYAFDYQMLAGAGFGVLFINPQGSTGYGSEFGLALNLRWGEIDYKDQMAALDHVIEKGYADPEKLGIYGLSYGGYMTCWMITQTNRFKGAVSENPVSDLASDYGVGDLSVWMNLDALGGHPHEVPEMYTRASPVTFAHQCKTPTLMLQGESDYRCPALNTEQFYTMLKVNHCTVEMVRLPGSVHAESIAGKPVIRRAQNEELLAWMKKYVQ